MEKFRLVLFNFRQKIDETFKNLYETRKTFNENLQNLYENYENLSNLIHGKKPDLMEKIQSMKELKKLMPTKQKKLSEKMSKLAYYIEKGKDGRFFKKNVLPYNSLR